MKWIYALVAVAAALLLVRESLLLTRSRRGRRAVAQLPAEPPDLRARLARRLYWPIVVALMTLVALAAMLTATLVAPR